MIRRVATDGDVRTRNRFVLWPKFYPSKEGTKMVWLEWVTVREKYSEYIGFLTSKRWYVIGWRRGRNSLPVLPEAKVRT